MANHKEYPQPSKQQKARKENIHFAKPPAKRSQHINTTYHNIVGPKFGSSGQTIATLQHNISQYLWVQHVACVWQPCYDVLRHVGYWKSKYIAQPRCNIVARTWPNDHNIVHHSKCCMKSLTSLKFETTTPNLLQHLKAGWPNARNMLLPKMLPYVTLKCFNLAGAQNLALRLQQIKAKYPNIAGPTFASSGQMIATSQHNISLHCFAQHVAHAWVCHPVATCCDMLGIEIEQQP